MDDQRRKLAQELDRLVDEGTQIYLAIEVLHGEQELLDGVQKALDGAGVFPGGKKKAKGDPEAETVSENKTFREIVKEKDFRKSYQQWYSEALRVVHQLLPDRYDEFRANYRLDKTPKSLEVTTYVISDFIHGVLVPRENIDLGTAKSITTGRIKDQVNILASARPRLSSILADIEGGLEAVLLDDELGAANGLLKAKHLRSAGIVAGVVLERHLKSILGNHGVRIAKKSQIAGLNDALKKASVFDNPRWREVQRLADIRNLCGHHGERQPTAEEVGELISGTEKIVKTVF